MKKQMLAYMSEAFNETSDAQRSGAGDMKRQIHAQVSEAFGETSDMQRSCTGNMKIYFAPLEGITGYLFRQTYEKHFGGVDCYYSPFVTTRDGGIMKNKEKRDILPENNQGYHLVPQVMTNLAGDFVQAAYHMEEMGYGEVNLNLGCPSGTVVSKYKGSGFLRRPDELERFLDEIFEKCPVQISIKTRIGFYEEDEFPHLLEIFDQYPLKELIIHPRTRKDMYKEPLHPEAFAYAVAHSRLPLVYNGDVCTAQDVAQIQEKYPGLSAVMIGRGFLMHPGFVKSGQPASDPENREEIFAFMQDLEHAYQEYMSGDTPVLFKMKEIWAFLKESVPDGDAWFKRVKKTKKLAEYDALMKEGFFYEGK